MIDRNELRRIARERLKEAEVLLKAGRYHGATYLGGYVVELALKNRICKTLKWKEFPQTRSEFHSFQGFKTHDLNVLLSLSGIETNIKTKYLADWSAVSDWDPEVRYDPIGGVTKADAELLIKAAKRLLGAI